MREAAAGFESRLRPNRGQDVAVRAGVSASGKGVKLIAGGKVGKVLPMKKKIKVKGEAEMVSARHTWIERHS